MTLFIIISAVIIAVVLLVLCRSLFQSGEMRNNTKLLALVLVLLLPTASSFIYLKIGSPKAFNTTVSESEGPQDSLSAEQIQRAITALETATRNNPSDQEKLSMLANSYLLQERYKDGAATYERMLKNKADPEIMLKAADTYTRIAGGSITVRATQLIEQALGLAPNNPQGLWLGGMAAAQSGDFASAQTYWERLLPLLSSAPQQQQELKQLIQQVVAEQAQGETRPKPDNLADTQAQTITGKTITVKVELDSELSDRVSSQDTVFIFAKAQNGPPAPLAVKKLTVADLPTQVVLSDQDAMMPQLTISKFPLINLTAKVSKTGNPTQTAGDLIAPTLAVDLSNPQDSYSLIISKSTE